LRANIKKSVENRLDLKKRLYHFQLKRGVSISDHINTCTKLLADLVNVDVLIEKEDKTLILLSSLPDKGYESRVETEGQGVLRWYIGGSIDRERKESKPKRRKSW